MECAKRQGMGTFCLTGKPAQLEEVEAANFAGHMCGWSHTFDAYESHFGR